ncbi:MAG: hypothetical protein J0L63_17600 [Anaerolineae bacterium]|nr:hypothetical protein [Anaerolineae bacterium]MBN8620734.1 hypothetical protein [Anaerolineae bacterium]
MWRQLLILIVLLAGILVVSQAQEPSTREIYTVLDYGENVFEPELWLASAQEEVGRSTAQWRSDPMSGLAYLSYLHFDSGIQPDQIDLIFNEDWFRATFANYQQWSETRNCQLEGITLKEFSLTQANLRYSMRYWIQPVSDSRVLTLFLIFPAASTETLDTYAEKLFPQAAVCVG